MSYPYREHKAHIRGLLPGVAAGGGGVEYVTGATVPLYDLDDSYATYYAGTVNLDAATGRALDLLGDLVREQRDGLGDHEYRRIIAGRRIARKGAVTYPRVWAGWLALSGATTGRMRTLPPASILLSAEINWVPSPLYLDRAGRVADALMGAGYEVTALLALPGTARFDELPGFGSGSFAYQLRTGRNRATT